MPIGIGHISGMIFAGCPRETIQLGIDALWIGCLPDYTHEEVASSSPPYPFRRFIADEKWIETQNI